MATYQEVQEYVAMAKGRLNDAIDSPIYICGMAPLDPDDPCYDIFHCDTTLDCETHLEPEYYVSRIEPMRLELCCHCAGVSKSPIELNTSLKAPEGPYSVVLPICKACLDSGCNIIVRSARQNAKAKHARLEAENARKLLDQDVDADVGAEAEDREEQPTSTECTMPKTVRKKRTTAKRYEKHANFPCSCMTPLNQLLY